MALVFRAILQHVPIKMPHKVYGMAINVFLCMQLTAGIFELRPAHKQSHI